ncbi:MAG: restriction endonuclease subunit S [Clostridia bacterium]|nr:restriction endonuclease subunit S [Clostridia bacterium]
MKVREICHSITDGSHNPPQGVEESKYLMLSSKNIFDDEITVDDPRFLTEEAFQQEDKRTMIVPGDVLLTIVGTVGRTAVVSDDMPRFTLQRSVAVLHPRREICTSRYLMYALQSRRAHIEKTARGVAQKGIYLGEVGDIDLPIPVLEQQGSIVGILDKVGRLVQTRQRQLRALDTLIKARFVEMFGDPLSGTDKWPIHTVGDVAESIDPQPSHRTPPVDEAGIPYVSIKDCDYKTGVIDFENARKVGRNVLEEHLQRYEVHDGDFIIGKIGTIGNPIFVPARKDYTLSANIVLIQPDKKKVSPYFLKYSFMSAYMDRQFEEAKNSTSQAAFGIQKVRAIKVMNPSIDIQYQFEAFAKQVDKSKVVVQKALDEAQLLFDSLMQKYFG